MRFTAAANTTPCLSQPLHKEYPPSQPYCPTLFAH